MKMSPLAFRVTLPPSASTRAPTERLSVPVPATARVMFPVPVFFTAAETVLDSVTTPVRPMSWGAVKRRYRD